VTDRVHTNCVMLSSIPDFRFLHPNKRWNELTPTKKYEPNLRGVGAVLKTRVGSALLPRLLTKQTVEGCVGKFWGWIFHLWKNVLPLLLDPCRFACPFV
jgi:hypothetical protein